MNREKTRDLLIMHYRTYPNLQIRDIFKYLYQSAFGCEHLVSSYAGAVEYIEKEYASLSDDNVETLDVLDGEYCRIPLSYLKNGLGAETFGKFFCASSKKEPGGKARLEEMLSVAKDMINEKALPFSTDEFENAVTAWKTNGYPPVRHSEIFRESYKPSYRVISNEYARLLPLLVEIDKKLRGGSAVVAIEGGSASGKTTLGETLSALYDCTVLHMDDFFLRPEQRTKERYAEVGGNVDRERFLEEVLIPLGKNQPIDYRRFNCSTMTIDPALKIIPKKLTVIEGAYSMHPELSSYYDLSLFLDIAPDQKKKRIAKRNSPQMAERFYNEWIPLERLYFSQMNVKERCDLSLDICE